MDTTAGQGRGAAALTRSRTTRERGQRPLRSPHGLLLNCPAFTQLMAERGKTSTNDIADYLELGYGTVYGALRGRPISDAFVSALVKKLHRGDDLKQFLITTEASAA